MFKIGDRIVTSYTPHQLSKTTIGTIVFIRGIDILIYWTPKKKKLH